MTARSPLTASDLIQIIAGDVTHMRTLEGRQQFEITNVAEGMPSTSLTLTPDAVKRVLMGLLKRGIVPQQAQAWASFVMRGYMSTEGKAILPILIPYDTNRELEIADAVARLEELGDLIDGTMDDDEIRHLMKQLDR
ncbi:MAG TPA: hypothetical protein VGQ61_07185 [Candidatus Angelobacter sp.]|jgi:hypothetical protein|nr:hypothetical protein [Candidatus Angelobacter sp.]